QTRAVQTTSLEFAQPRGRSLTELVLQVEHLSAEHRSGLDAVVAAHDVSFEVQRGSCVALVGESGSGKTTIARAIAGLHRPSAGTISVCGEPVAGLVRHRTAEQRRRVQLVSQN